MEIWLMEQEQQLNEIRLYIQSLLKHDIHSLLEEQQRVDEIRFYIQSILKHALNS